MHYHKASQRIAFVYSVRMVVLCLYCNPSLGYQKYLRCWLMFQMPEIGIRSAYDTPWLHSVLNLARLKVRDSIRNVGQCRVEKEAGLDVGCSLSSYQCSEPSKRALTRSLVFQHDDNWY
jgi:hypothetical protein